MTKVKTLLAMLNLGNSVAEFDEDLESYFVETNVFHEIVNDQKDIVAGDKGTGKTALFRFIAKRQNEIKELENIFILPAFNLKGGSIFSTLTEKEQISEAEYSVLWKSYILSLAGNELIRSNKKLVGSTLDLLLQGLGLRVEIPEPKTVLNRIMSKLPNFFNWQSAEMELSFSESGIPIIKPKIEFGGAKEEKPVFKGNVNDALDYLDKLIESDGGQIWVTFDRLDEAFQGHPDVEVMALRALLRTYLDFSNFTSLKMKLFLRKDLFRRVISGGFVNLTHINARKIEIVWDDEDLLNLLIERVRKNPSFVKELGVEGQSDTEIFDRLFPDQVDFGKRKPKTLVWIMRRIRDGNDVKPPRHLIDLIKFAREAQLRIEDREPRELTDAPLIESEAMRKGLTQLSNERVSDTLLAESGIYAPMIEKFRDGKAEHNVSSLSELLGLKEAGLRAEIKPLVEMGFLEDIKGTYKIPTLYREGLGVTQGKAFEDSSTDDEEDE